MWSASRPWPQASWNRMPPLPRPAPPAARRDGAGRADSLVRAWAAAGGPAPRPSPVEQLEPERAGGRLVAGLHPGVAQRPRTTRRTGCGPGRRRPGARRSWRPASAAGCRRSRPDLADGAARRPGRLVGPGQQFDLASALGDVLGDDGRPRGAGGPRRGGPPSGPRRRPARATAAAASAAAQQARPRSGRRCGRSRWSRPTPPVSRAPVTARRQLLDPAVVEHGRRVDRRSSTNTSANSPPVRRASDSTRSSTVIDHGPLGRRPRRPGPT